MDPGEVYVPPWDYILVSSFWAVGWLVLFAGVLIYPFPRGVIQWPVKVGAGLASLAELLELLHTVGVFGRYPFLGERPPFLEVLMMVSQIGKLIGYFLVAFGSWKAGRRMARMAKESHLGPTMS